MNRKRKGNHPRRGKDLHQPRRSQPGAPPGTLVSHHQRQTSIEIHGYGKDQFEYFELSSVHELKKKCVEFPVAWINVVGLANLELISEIGHEFGIHKLTLEDILNLHQRPKFESYPAYEYVVCRMARFRNGERNLSIETEQLSIVRVSNCVFTFQEVEADCLDPVRRRIREKSGIIRERRPDYLVYAIIDSVIDHYFPLIDSLSERVAEYDDTLVNQARTVSAREIHGVRRDLLKLGRVARPHREMLAQILRDSDRFAEPTQVFLNDCYDHAIQLSEMIDSNREICSDLRSYHLALMGSRTNDVMKTLTIVSTIFIPLSFIAGIYGMNFDNIPELHWNFGYFAAWLVMLCVAGGLLLWFKWRGWFEASDE